MVSEGGEKVSRTKLSNGFGFSCQVSILSLHLEKISKDKSLKQISGEHVPEDPLK